MRIPLVRLLQIPMVSLRVLYLHLLLMLCWARCPNHSHYLQCHCSCSSSQQPQDQQDLWSWFQWCFPHNLVCWFRSNRLYLRIRISPTRKSNDSSNRWISNFISGWYNSFTILSFVYHCYQHWYWGSHFRYWTISHHTVGCRSNCGGWVDCPYYPDTRRCIPILVEKQRSEHWCPLLILCRCEYCFKLWNSNFISFHWCLFLSCYHRCLVDDWTLKLKRWNSRASAFDAAQTERHMRQCLH